METLEETLVTPYVPSAISIRVHLILLLFILGLYQYVGFVCVLGLYLISPLIVFE